MEQKVNAITPVKIIVIVLILIIIVGMCYIFIHKKDETKIVKETELIHLTFDDIVENHILFSDIKIFKKDHDFYLTAKATNMTSNILNISPITITLTDQKNKNTILISYIGETINSENSRNIIIKTNKNLKNTKHITVNIETQVQSWVFKTLNL